MSLIYKIKKTAPGIFLYAVLPFLLGVTLAFFGLSLLVFAASSTQTFKEEYINIFCQN